MGEGGLGWLTILSILFILSETGGEKSGWSGDSM